MKNIIVSLCTVIPLISFAADDAYFERCLESRSKAGCLLDFLASDTRPTFSSKEVIKDNKLSEIPNIQFEKPENSNATGVVLSGAVATSEFMVGGALHNAFGTLFVLDMLMPSHPNFEDVADIYALIPEDISKELNSVDDYIRDLQIKAITAVFKTTEYKKNKNRWGGLIFTGGSFCGDSGCEFFSPQLTRIGSSQYKENIKKIPSWIGDGRVNFIPHAWLRICKHDENTQCKAQDLPLEILHEIMKELPDWFYAYRPSYNKNYASIVMNGKDVLYTAFDKK